MPIPVNPANVGLLQPITAPIQNQAAAQGVKGRPQTKQQEQAPAPPPSPVEQYASGANINQTPAPQQAPATTAKQALASISPFAAFAVKIANMNTGRFAAPIASNIKTNTGPFDWRQNTPLDVYRNQKPPSSPLRPFDVPPELDIFKPGQIPIHTDPPDFPQQPPQQMPKAPVDTPVKPVMPKAQGTQTPSSPTPPVSQQPQGKSLTEEDTKANIAKNPYPSQFAAYGAASGAVAPVVKEQHKQNLQKARDYAATQQMAMQQQYQEYQRQRQIAWARLTPAQKRQIQLQNSVQTRLPYMPPRPQVYNTIVQPTFQTRPMLPPSYYRRNTRRR